MKQNKSRLVERACADLFEFLSTTNDLNDEHREALRAVIRAYADLSHGLAKVIAFPLAMGLGKTQSIVSWCHAVIAEGQDDLSVLVCGEQLRDLTRLKAQLISRGVPEERIGFIHTDRSTPGIEPSSSGRPDDYQFLLVSHQMIRCREDITPLNSYRGAQRSLCVWDESLVRNDGGYMTAHQISRALRASKEDVFGDFVRHEHKDLTEIAEVIRYLRQGLERVKREYEAQYGGHAEPAPICDIQQLDADTRARYRATIRQYVSDKDDRNVLFKFLELCQDILRVSIVGGGTTSQGVISYIPRVPRDLDKLVILDASCLVRELSRMDPDVEVVDRWAKVKSFENVYVRQYVDFHGGWHSIQRLRRNSLKTRRIVEEILKVPAGEAILICSKKPRQGKRGPIDAVLSCLVDLSIDPYEEICVNGGSKPRISTITWGQHKATSEFSFCKHIFVIGVLRRNELDLSSAIGAQKEDLTDQHVACRDAVRRVMRSEMFYCLQQLIGRGPAREVERGKAREAYIHVYDQERFDELIEEGLPNINWTTVESTFGARISKTEAVAQQIVSYLRSSGANRIPIRRLKADLGLQSVPNETFQRARRCALDTVNADAPNTDNPYEVASVKWELEKRSLVRA